MTACSEAFKTSGGDGGHFLLIGVQQGIQFSKKLSLK